MRHLVCIVVVLASVVGGTVEEGAAQSRYRGNLSSNPYDPDSTANRFGRFGSPYSPDSIQNEFVWRGPLRLYDQGHYRGCLNCSEFDPDSVWNRFGRYGSEYSPDSIRNEFGAGNPYAPSSPVNPFGPGWQIYEDE